MLIVVTVFVMSFAVLARDRTTSRLRADLLAAVPMKFGTATATNLATLVRAVCVLFGLPANNVVACTTDGAMNMRAMCRELSVHNQWCAAHRADLIAKRGLLRLSVAPNKSGSNRQSKTVYASDAGEAVVTRLNNLCALLETPTFRLALKSNVMQNEPVVVHFEMVCAFSVCVSIFQNVIIFQPSTTRWYHCCTS